MLTHCSPNNTNLLNANTYNYNFLFDLQPRFRSVQGSGPYTSEFGERTEKRGNGLHIPTLGIQENSNSPRCGQTHAIPSPSGKLERGN
jgi:hypothetical protein